MAAALYSAAAEIAAEHHLPPEAIAAIVATLTRHKLARSRSAVIGDEVTTSQAARMLNVDRKTLRRYLVGGLLPFRDKAAPGSTQPRRLIRVADVERIKAYGFAAPAEVAAPRQTRTRPAAAQFMHLDLSATF